MDLPSHRTLSINEKKLTYQNAFLTLSLTAKKQSSAITGHFAQSSFVKRLVTNAYLLGLSTACWIAAVTSMESDFLSDTLPRPGVAPYLDQMLAKISGLSSPTVEYYLLAATLISHAYCVKFDLGMVSLFILTLISLPHNRDF